MKDMEKLKERLCEELERYAKEAMRGTIDLQTIHMLTDTIKNLDKIEMLEDEESEYSSARRRRDSRGRYSREGGGYSRGENYDGGESLAGGGRGGGDYSREGGYGREGGGYSREGGGYSRDGGYSRAGGKDRIKQMLEDMRMQAQGSERQNIDRMLEMAERL